MKPTIALRKRMAPRSLSYAVAEGRNRRRMQSVRMVDVARLARVSPSTVSLYLRHPSSVTQETGSTIERAIRQSGLCAATWSPADLPPRVHASSASLSRRCAMPSSPKPCRPSRTLLAKEGFHTLIGHTEYSLEQEEELVRAALSWAPAGIILTGLEHSDMTRKMLASHQAPVIEMWETGEEPIDMNVGFSHGESREHGGAPPHLPRPQATGFSGARLEEDTRAAQRCEGFRKECLEAGSARRSSPTPRRQAQKSGGILLGQMLAQGSARRRGLLQ